MKFSRTSTKRNKMWRRSPQREKNPVLPILRGGRRHFSLYTLLADSRRKIHSIENSPHFRDLKSNPLLVGELATQKQNRDMKKYFSRNGCGGVQINRCFTEQIFYVKKVLKTARKSLFLFRKVSPAFLEHSLFLLVFKQITDVAL